MTRPFLILILILIAFGLCIGCARKRTLSQTRVESALSLPLKLTPQQLSQSIIESQHKRVWGRLTAFEEVERIVHQLGPFIEEASLRPGVQPSLRMMARDAGISTEEARRRWMRLHEADILLESGGRDDAVSVSNAIGVAQWIAGTAKRAGLKVDIAESHRLTAKIDALQQGFPLNEPILDPVRPQIEELRRKRRLFDHRYDPRAALIAQARYMLGLYPRFPDSMWILQAYHGGEAGVTRTLAKFLGGAWPGSSAAAIRRGNRGSKLTFEHLYLTTTPKNLPDAFSYLYGRSDDHRYYGWKVRSALEAFALYRKDPGRFRRSWEALLPGRAKEAFWYPRPVAARSLAPETTGALKLVRALYRRHGGSGELTVGDSVLTFERTAATRALAAARDARRRGNRPPPDLSNLPGGGPPADTNYHEMGLALDIKRPTDARNRKILEYALGWLADRQILWWRTDDIDSGGEGRRHYHFIPNPRYRIPLEQIARKGKLPL